MTEVKIVPMLGRDKIKTIDELVTISDRLHDQNMPIVHAHGAFDLLHLGHIRHLEAAKALGSILIVTVTADQFVRKGPGRPVFGEYVRAEMVAGLECVDYVAVNYSPDAVPAIEAIRPDVYVKGQDYENPDGDVTGKIAIERETVETYGGRVEFTNEVTFSSSSLINQHLNVFDPQVRDYLGQLRNDGGLAEMLDLIERVKDYRVLMIGDTILDEYQYTFPMGKAPKESIITARFQDSELFAGGVIAAANHIAGICKQVDVITAIGDDGYEEFIFNATKPNVSIHALARAGAPTTRKCRFIDPTQMRKLFEVYIMDDAPLSKTLHDELNRQIATKARDYDLVLVVDFGHGLITTPETINTITAYSQFLAVNAQSNSANHGYNLITKYDEADYVCIDAPEARLALSDRDAPVGDLARRLLSNEEGLNCPKIIITQGRHGCLTYEQDGIAHTIPAFAKNVVDTMGAGDAFIAITAPLVRAGGKLNQIGFIGNVVGALKVGIVGHRSSIDKVSLIKSITGLLK